MLAAEYKSISIVIQGEKIVVDVDFRSQVQNSEAYQEVQIHPEFPASDLNGKGRAAGEDHRHRVGGGRAESQEEGVV
ncbi:hypothetical protein MLD38_025054 [Melastoma candidum]|uniref:Uncharacterized protein n=1 Tax=Melastoma candidum TaxID=119954 RepID=A0ACB9NVS3_9MYRT|nr:hypothetical protein MLD38_025054 [Melastoma candidum]